MKVPELSNSLTIRPLKFSRHEVPHVTIEPNRTCNMKCKMCYNLDKLTIKSTTQILREIEIARQKRRLETITLVGGEPLLHDSITDIISVIKSKGYICQLFTNGALLLDDNGDAILQKLGVAGLDRIFLHVDVGQECRSKELDLIISRLFEKLESHKIPYSLAVTLYHRNSKKISSWIKRFTSNKYFDGIFAVPATDPLLPAGQECNIKDEYDSISEKLGVEPTTYLPSNQSDDDVTWLLYYFFRDAASGNSISVSPFIYRLVRILFRLCKGYYPYALKVTRRSSRLLFPFVVFLEGLINITKFVSYMNILLQSLITGLDVRLYHIVLQEPPHMDPNRKELIFCFRCPDATIRKGSLVPVCVADRLVPLRSDITDKQYGEEIMRSVHQHLNLTSG